MALTDLDQYLYLSGTSSARFARIMGVSKQTVDNWRYGRYSHNGRKDDIAEAIEQRNTELRLALELGDRLSGNFVLS